MQGRSPDSADWRIGIGYDLHAVVTGRPLRLGGIDIPWDRGLGGHSDGDVVLHAVIDGLFGAAGLPDIGDHFPDTDPAYAGMDSCALMRRAVEEVAGQGWQVHNLDVMIHAERPRLGAHKPAIRESLSRLVGVSAERIAVKAKTNEGLDAVGRGEAIACHVAVLLKRGG